MFCLLLNRFPSSASGKESACNAMQDDPGSIPGLGRYPPGGGNGSQLQYSGLEDPMERGACWAAAHGVTESGLSG